MFHRLSCTIWPLWDTPPPATHSHPEPHTLAYCGCPRLPPPSTSSPNLPACTLWQRGPQLLDLPQRRRRRLRLLCQRRHLPFLPRRRHLPDREHGAWGGGWCWRRVWVWVCGLQGPECHPPRPPTHPPTCSARPRTAWAAATHSDSEYCYYQTAVFHEAAATPSDIAGVLLLMSSFSPKKQGLLRTPQCPSCSAAPRRCKKCDRGFYKSLAPPGSCLE